MESKAKMVPESCSAADKVVGSIAEEDALARSKLDAPTLCRLTTNEVYGTLDEYMYSLSNDWKGSVIVEGWLLHRGVTDISSIFEYPPQKYDICDYLDGQGSDNNVIRLYLNPDAYRERTPPGQQMVENPDDEGKCPGWTDSLKNTLRDVPTLVAIQSSATGVTDKGTTGSLYVRIVTG